MPILLPTDFYVIRTSNYSINELLDLNKYFYQQDIISIKKKLAEEVFLNAIYFSSRYFHGVVLEWLKDDKITFNPHDKILVSLYKYYSRFCSRSTPYGLFAGFACGNITDKQSFLELAEPRNTPIIRADMLFLKKIKDEILRLNRYKHIVYYPNNTIYSIGSRLRFIEWDKDYNYELSEVSNTLILDKILKSSSKGLTFPQITKLIQTEVPHIKKLEIENYIESLIDNKMLIDRLPPFITNNRDPVKDLINQLNTMNIDSDIIIPLNKYLEENNNLINTNHIEFLASHYHYLLDSKMQLFQVDLKINFKNNNLNRQIIEILSKRASELAGLITNVKLERILSFSQRFSKKFEEREVPLSHALDPEWGVGYDYQISGNVEETPLIKNIYFTYKNKETNDVAVPDIIRLILKKYIHLLNPEAQETISLSEDDIKLSSNNHEIVDTQQEYYLFGDLLAESQADLDNNKFKFFNKSSLPTPFMSNILSRFAYHDPYLQSKIESFLPKDDEDFIYAEIVHYPSERLGNVLLRPTLYNYEITYITENDGNKPRIDINDIMVRVRGNNLILRSKSLNKEVRPRLSSAYNYTNNQLAVIRFLCDFQYYNNYNGFNWDWSILNNCIYLPRVEYKELILAEARWRLVKNTHITIALLKDVLCRLKIPRYCTIKENDNVLLLDTENETCIEIIRSKVNDKDCILYESFKNSSLPINGKERYSAEFIFPLIKKKSYNLNHKEKTVKSLKKNKEDMKSFTTGSEWSYFKIYCSHAGGDKIIKEILNLIIDKVSQKSLNIIWFYIRYQDPENHIRLRIKTILTSDLILQLNQYFQPYIEEGFVSSFQIDTYTPEIERYGREKMELSEQLFYYDSISVMRYIEKEEDMNGDLRWQIGVVSIDLLLDDFAIPLYERITLLENLYINLMPEYVDITNKEYMKLFKNSLDKQLRNYKQFLDNVLRLKSYVEFEESVMPFLERSNKITKIAFEIKENIPKETLHTLLQSYVHMTLNRLFFTKARMHELVLYFFMKETYNAIVRRNDE